MPSFSTFPMTEFVHPSQMKYGKQLLTSQNLLQLKTRVEELVKIFYQTPNLAPAPITANAEMP